MIHSQHTMQAAAIDRFGGPELLKPHLLPLPEVGADEILIRVETAGVGVWDPLEREGVFENMMGGHSRFPYIIGTDGAGTVAAVGSKVKGFKEGDRVYAFSFMNPKGGFYAQYAAVKAKDASLIPGNLTMQQAGALPCDGITALCGLEQVLHLKKGESIMIFGASGGIGHLAVQLARRMGARVFAVASGKDGCALVHAIGADEVVDGHSDDVLSAANAFSPQGMDCALVTAGGKTTQQAMMAMRQGGRVAYPNGVDPAPRPIAGVTATAYDGKPTPQLIKKLNQLIEQGPFEVHVARTFPLKQASKAHAALTQHYVGKLALQMN